MSKRSPWITYGIAILATGLALAAALWIPGMRPYPFIMLIAVLLLSALVGGLRAAITSLALSTFGLIVFFFAHPAGLEFNSVNGLRLAFFTFSAVFMVGLLYRSEAAAARLAEERERLRVTLASIGDGVIAVDTAGRVTFMNHVAAQLTRWPAAEAQGMPLSEVFRVEDEETRQPVRDLAAAILRNGSAGALPQTALLITRDGKTLPVEDSAAPILDGSGQTVGAILVFHDRTERRLTERALTEANQSFRALFDAAPLAIIVYDLDGCVRMWSPAAHRTTGYTEQDALGRIPPTIPPDRLDEFHQMLAAAAAQPVVLDLETQRIHKDGTVLDVIFSIAALRDAHGAVSGFISISNDISEVKRAQRALLQSEQHLRKVLDSLFAFVGVLTPEGTLLEANRAALEVARLNPEDVLGKPFDQAPWWSESPQAQAHIREAISRAAQGQPTRLDLAVLRRTRQVIMVDFMLAPMLDDQGQVTHLVASAIDVSARYQVNAQLAESEARYRAIGESIPYGIWITDALGKANYLSQSFLDLVGMGMDEAAQFGWVSKLPPEQQARTLADWNAHVQSGELWSYEHQFLGADGEYHTILSRGVPVRDAGGQITAWAGVNLDITARKHEEHLNILLQEITAGLSEAVTPQQVAEAVVSRVKDALGGHLMSVMHVVPPGVEVELLSTQGLTPSVEERYRRIPLTYPGALTHAIHHGEAVFIDNQADYLARFPETADVIMNETHSHATACVPMKIGERVMGGIGISFPAPHPFAEPERRFLFAVAEQCALALERARLFEAEAEARRAAERADWLKTRFLAVVSHELRTPLTSIKGFATTLLEEDVDWDADSQRDFVQIINNESDKLGEMIDQLLDFSRLESGNLRIHREPTLLSDILNVVLPQLHVLASEHPLSLDIPPDLPPLDADRRRIAQVITNIVGNAVRYSPPHTPITLRASVDRGHIRLDITDQGPGIPPEERAAVFEAFRQGGKHQDADTKGAGLGLAIAKGIIEAHEGRIWIDDRPLPGTTVCLMLPIDLRIDEA